MTNRALGEDRRPAPTRHSRTIATVLAVIVAIPAFGLAAAVSYGASCIQRGASWKGFAFDHGLALVYSCAEDSGVIRGFFFIWPWKKVELEKRDSGA